MTVEDNDEILYTNIYKQYISNFKKIKLKNDKDEVVARLKRRSSYWKRWKTLLPSNFAPNHLFWKNIPDQSNNLLQTIARELDSWKCPYRMSRGGVGGGASARSRLLPLCSNVIQVTEKFSCGFRYLVKRSDYLTRISKIAIFSDVQIIKEMKSQFIRNSFLSKRLQKQNFSFYFWGPRPYFWINFSSAWGF